MSGFFTSIQKLHFQRFYAHYFSWTIRTFYCCFIFSSLTEWAITHLCLNTVQLIKHLPVFFCSTFANEDWILTTLTCCKTQTKTKIKYIIKKWLLVRQKLFSQVLYKQSIQSSIINKEHSVKYYIKRLFSQVLYIKTTQSRTT